MSENLKIFFAFIRKLFESRYMIRMMAVRALKQQYVGSLFGFFWAVLNPLFQLTIYGIVFGLFFKSKPDASYGTDSYFLFLLTGLIPWQFFAQTVTESTSAVVASSNLIKKSVAFPSEILPIITLFSNLISHMVGVVLLLVIQTILTGRLSIYSPAIFIYLFFISLFTVGAGWIFSSINVYFRDIHQVVGVIMMGLFFFIPIVYPPSLIPPRMLPFMKINPMYHMVEGYRYALLADRFLPLGDILNLAGTCVVTFALGGIFFRKLKPGFAEVL